MFKTSVLCGCTWFFVMNFRGSATSPATYPSTSPLFLVLDVHMLLYPPIQVYFSHPPLSPDFEGRQLISLAVDIASHCLDGNLQQIGDFFNGQIGLFHAQPPFFVRIILSF